MHNSNHKTIGIIGGMGPLTTVELFDMIVRNTDSKIDQGHIRIVIDNNTRIPDRTNAILGKGESPVPEIVKAAKGLISIGADFLIMPCNTSHYYFDVIQNQVDVEILNMILETGKEVRKEGLHKIGLLATKGTINGNVYSKYFASLGIEIVYPDVKGQNIVMDFIYSGVKAYNYNYDCTDFLRVVDELFKNGAETMVLGCTEIPVGMTMYSINFQHIDALEVLAKRAIIKAGYVLRK